MIFEETKLAGAYFIELDKHEDDRGFFARTFCQAEFERSGLNPRVVQCSVSYNRKRGTLRGMHFQIAPNQEVKVVRCLRGSIFDAIIDLRESSPTFMQHVGAVLSHDNARMLYVPEGFAHGFQTLEDDTEVSYHMSASYAPESARGVRWNDPAFRIEWPSAERTIVRRDQEYPDFSPAILK